MRIVMITGSPHKNGTSAILAANFIRGAKEAGHEVFRFDGAFRKVHPCIACEKCHTTETGCAFKDDMEELKPKLLEADAVVFVTPIYYYDMNAQIKAVIDRFYAITEELSGMEKKTALMLTCGDTTMTSADGAIESYKGIVNYFGWHDSGTIAAVGSYTVDDINASDYPEQAYKLGKNFR